LNLESSFPLTRTPNPESRIPAFPTHGTWHLTFFTIIEAMGGHLDIRAVLPNGVVRINQFEEVHKAVRPNPAAGK
jgi:hypothetical protein